MKDRVALGLAAAVFVVHVATSNRYGVFRHELYFIVCGRHPAFGYADQPPLVPLAAAGLYALGAQTWVLRILDAIAAALVVWFTVRFTRLLGGTDAAAWAAGITAGTAPVLLGLDLTVNTTAFEPLAWTAVAYFLARWSIGHDDRCLLWCGVVVGIAMETIGAVVFEYVVRSVPGRVMYLAAGTALAALAAPVFLPILDPAALLAYQRTLHLAPKEQERSDRATPLPSLFADMLGWHDFVRQVADAYDRVSAARRARTSIVVDNYGEAAAIDVYGSAYGLPPAISGHNQYGLWGLHGQDPTTLVRVQDDIDALRPFCRHVSIVAYTHSRYARGFETAKPVRFERLASTARDNLSRPADDALVSRF